MARWVAAALAVTALTACLNPDASTPAGTARVLSIVDGDTVVLEIGGSRETTRLLGIDTPETNHPTRPVECYGAEATARLTDLLPVGSVVRVERDIEGRDHYDRLLLYIFDSDDDRLINLAMVEEGYAVALHVSPNGAHRRAFAAAEAEARRSGLGLWGTCGGPGLPIDPVRNR